MKQKISSKWLSVFCAVALALVLAAFGRTSARAEGGSYLDVVLLHDYESCEGCYGTDRGQKVLTGSTHTFTLDNVPDEIKDCKVTWSIIGTNQNATIVESTDTYAKVRFDQAADAESSNISTCVEANFDVSDVYPGEIVYADYWVGVYDQFYASLDTENVFMNVGSTKTLTCDTVLYDAQHPQGEKVTLTDVTWEASATPLNPNTDGLSISASGVVSASAGGSYWVMAKDSSGLYLRSFYVRVPHGSITAGKTVTVKSGTEAVYTFQPEVTGAYIFQGNMYVLYDGSGQVRGEWLGDDKEQFSLTAGTVYYLSVYNGSIDMDASISIQAPAETKAETYTITFNKNGGTKLSASNKVVVNGKTYGKLPTVGRKNYTFKGWYTAKSGGKKITANTKVSLTKNQTLYAQWTKVKAPGKPKAPVLKNVSGKKLSVKLKKVSGAKGYEIVYSTNAKFKSSKKTTATTLSKTIKSLKKGKTYYVKVRAYKVDSLKNKVYGKYSAVKKIKIKK